MTFLELSFDLFNPEISYILFENYLKSCNFKFVLIKKRFCLSVTQLR